MTLALFLAILGPGSRWGQPAALCEIVDSRVTESSGLASSHLTAGSCFTHNDSGDTARYFKFDPNGNVTGVFSLKGIVAVDWEDMASAKVNGKPYLYLADIGDNAARREWISVYRVPEPGAPGARPDERETYRLTYPDKPHDCEAIFVQPGSGRIWLVTKERTSTTKVFSFLPVGPGNYTLELAGELKVDTGGLGGKLVTGADASPDGKWVVVRTYSGALEYSVTGKFADWWKATPTRVDLAVEVQGEAVCYSSDGTRMLTSSEGNPCRVSSLLLK